MGKQPTPDESHSPAERRVQSCLLSKPSTIRYTLSNDGGRAVSCSPFREIRRRADPPDREAEANLP